MKPINNLNKKSKVEACRKPKCKERKKMSKLSRVSLVASIAALLRERKREIGY